MKVTEQSNVNVSNRQPAVTDETTATNVVEYSDLVVSN